MNRRVAFSLVASVLLLAGAGCTSSKPPSVSPPAPLATETPTTLPTLEVLHPQNNTAVTGDATSLIGTTDGNQLTVNGNLVPIQAGRFETAISLLPGKNTIKLSATNVLGSTDATLVVTRSAAPAPASAPPTKTPTKPVPTKTPPVTTPTQTPAPTITAPKNVTFVSDEVQSTAVLSTYGASIGWTRATKSFKGYAVVKSTTDPSPYYPNVWQSVFLSDIDSTQWIDKNVEKGKKTYYRVCVVAVDGTSRCGSVSSVTKP